MRQFMHLWHIVIAFLLVGVVIFGTTVYDVSLWQSNYFTGWILLISIVILILLNVRKKLYVIPIGRVYKWIHIHIFTGFLCMFVFFAHIYSRSLAGVLESALAIFFAIVCISGLVGFMLNQRFPKRLTRRGDEVIFERIPLFIALLRDDAEAIILKSMDEVKSTTLAEFYALRLQTFFSGPRNRGQHLLALTSFRFQLLNDMRSLERYLNAKESQLLHELTELVKEKDDLDYHYALQSALRLWLFIHVPFTYGLLLLIIVHAVVAYGFRNGLS